MIFVRMTVLRNKNPASIFEKKILFPYKKQENDKPPPCYETIMTFFKIIKVDKI